MVTVNMYLDLCGPAMTAYGSLHPLNKKYWEFRHSRITGAPHPSSVADIINGVNYS
jgi:hypothetical protein